MYDVLLCSPSSFFRRRSLLAALIIALVKSSVSDRCVMGGYAHTAAAQPRWPWQVALPKAFMSEPYVIAIELQLQILQN